MNKSKIYADAWKMSNGEQFKNNYQAWLNAGLIPSYSNANNAYLDTKDNNKTSMDYSDAGETAGGVFGSIFGGPLGGAIGSMAGNLIGQGVNYAANKSLQENQLSNQMELQNRAYMLNQQAAQNQAQNEVIGMQQAGLNPAGVNGQGAPSLQAGAAAGANSTMGNIFGGLAEMIAAIKAPTEIEKMQAEKALTEGQTEKTAAETDLTREQKYNLQLDSDLIKPEQARELFERANKHIQDAQNALAQADNTNAVTDIINAQNDFIKKYSSSIYSSYMNNLKSTKQWDKLPPRTRETIEKLASGEIEMGTGELQGLKEIINSQTGLLERDRDALNAMLDTIVTRKQIDTRNVINALRDLPVNQRKLMFSQITDYYAQAKKAGADASRTGTLEWLDRMNSDTWLIEHGLTDELERKKYKEVLNNLLKLTDPNTYTNVIGGGLIGRGLSNTSKSLGPTQPKSGKFYTGGLKGYQEHQYKYFH